MYGVKMIIDAVIGTSHLSLFRLPGVKPHRAPLATRRALEAETLVNSLHCFETLSNVDILIKMFCTREYEESRAKVLGLPHAVG